MMQLRKRTLSFILIFIFITSLCWYYSKKAEVTDAASDKIPPTPVTVASVSRDNWQAQFQATGTLNAVEGVMLKSEAAGRVTKVFFTSGQTVKAGDPLLEINPSIVQAQLVAAQAKATLTHGDYNRAIALYQRGALSRQDLDTALANKNADTAQVEQLQAQLNQNIIRAPFNGRLGLRLFSLGDYINVGQNLANLQSLSRLQVDFVLPENNAGTVHIGDNILLTSDIFPGSPFKGKIQAIDSAIDTHTRTIAYRAEIPNPQEKLLPGSFVQVDVMAGKASPLLTIPQTAVVYDVNGDYVFTVVKGRAVKKLVTIIRKNTDQVAIAQGIHIGDCVITEGQLKISDGSPVTLLTNPPGSGT